MTQHTQGEWHLDAEGNICIADGRIVVRDEHIHAHNVRNMAFENPKQLLEKDDGGEANARLIAAAPKLLNEVSSYEELGAKLDSGNYEVDEILGEYLALFHNRKAIAAAKGAA